ncbi:MAG: hypothetical protein K0S44_1415 [Bacteroidetes bacterium]|jgi:hypothetical protein|nr:hypothetical protein [Bacteroidota bacterium]
MKTLILIIISLVISGPVLFAQDTIFKKNNESVPAKILEISPTEVRYNLFDLPNGPVHTINRENILRIKYSNGTTDVFSTDQTGTEKPIDITPRYILTMIDGTQLKGKVIKETKTEIVFLDNNFGEKTISKNRIKTLNSEYGNDVNVFTLKDGSIITGKIINRSREAVVIQTAELGVISLSPGNIKNEREFKDATVSETGTIWFKNPNSTRYLFAPSAFQLKKGEGYYQNIYGAGNAVNYGITDNITIGGGLMGPFAAYMNIKAGVKLGEYVNIAGGAIVGNALFPINGNSTGVGLGFGVVTIGNYDHNITFGSGYGFLNENGKVVQQKKPMYVVNGMARLGKKHAFVTENWIVNIQGDPFGRGLNSSSHYETFFSYAFRFMGERSTLDAGFINTPALIEKGWYIGIPYIGFVIRFGNYKDE